MSGLPSGSLPGSVLANKAPRIYLYETVFPDYRMGLFAALKEQYGNDITLACGAEGFSPTLRTSAAAVAISIRLQNRYLFRRQLLWQYGMLSEATEADLVIAEFSLRAVSTWWLLLRRSAKRKPTILWGHASGTRRLSSLVRRWMFDHCNGFIAYMPREKGRVLAGSPDLPVWVAPNSFMWASECHGTKRPPEDINDVIYVGRLVAHKKVRLLLDGFILAASSGGLPPATRLLLVGDGPEKTSLQEHALVNGMAERVVFCGHISSVDQLREFYSRALVAVSPGCVGLAATQSLGFGVPILIADDEPHGPEVEICKANENALFFRAGDASALADSLKKVVIEKESWLIRRESISAFIRANYTFDKMLETFARVIAENVQTSKPPLQPTVPV